MVVPMRPDVNFGSVLTLRGPDNDEVRLQSLSRAASLGVGVPKLTEFQLTSRRDAERMFSTGENGGFLSHCPKNVQIKMLVTDEVYAQLVAGGANLHHFLTQAQWQANMDASSKAPRLYREDPNRTYSWRRCSVTLNAVLNIGILSALTFQCIHMYRS